MKLLLPATFNVNKKVACGIVQWMAENAKTALGQVFKYTSENGSWLKFTADDSPERTIHLFRSKPSGIAFAPEDRVLVSSTFPAEPVAFLDASRTEWQQAADVGEHQSGESETVQVLESWRGAFHYVDEYSVAGGMIGLRRPQIGALHAIHAHWAVSNDVATVVMPTGTGKTETMLATAISAQCKKILVIVPTDALRTQIAEKFSTLGVLKMNGSVILDDKAHRPIVGTLTSRPKSEEAVDEMFNQCNVVVTTSSLASGCRPEVTKRIAEHCSHLFIDEAHHAEAPTWRNFKLHFSTKRVLQFTATPFREDDKRIDGKIIFVYPLRLAQKEGYFQKIRFSPVSEFSQGKADKSIAEQVVKEIISDTTGKHVAMARVSSIDRAEEVIKIYREIGQFNPIVLHSKITPKERALGKEKLQSGSSRIVVCVDMLGEGFDMPELKIAAFHDLRKSLAVTLQLAGRFTRTRADLGAPVFIANTASIDLSEELERLYTQDPDWNQLLPELSESAIAEELGAQDFMAGFSGNLGGIPVKELNPSASTVVYRTTCANWTPKRFKLGRSAGRFDQLSHAINDKDCTLVVITASRKPVPWTDVAVVQDYAWDMYLAYWDRELQLLFIHGSNNNGEFKDLAKSLCGNDVSIVVDPVVYRVFHGIKRMLLINVGLDEHFGRQVKYTGRMGADVGSRLSASTKRGAKKAVLGAIGYEMGERISFGAAKRGRVWSAQRLRVDTFATWCKHIGAKINDDTIDPDEVLKGTLIPKQVSSRPFVFPIGVEWPALILDAVESMTTLMWPTTNDKVTDVGIEMLNPTKDGELDIRVFSEKDSITVRLEIFQEGSSSDFRFSYVGPGSATIKRAGDFDLCEFLTQNPPTIWFANGSSLEGNLLVEVPTSVNRYPIEKLQVIDWAGVNIKSESQKPEKRPDSIQYRLIEELRKKNSYQIIFDDDDAGEAADVVTMRLDDPLNPRVLHIEFYHCKFSVGDKPGGRVDDLYVVCGQAQRSIVWLHNRDRKKDLFDHLLKREARRLDRGKSSRFEVGDEAGLIRYRDLSKRLEVKLAVFAVQPGVSRALVSESQLTLLAVVENFLAETYQLEFTLICHD